MPDFKLSISLANDFVKKNNTTSMSNDVIEKAGLTEVDRLIKKYRPNAIAPNEDLLVAIRQVETDPRWGEWSVGDLYKRYKHKWAEYEELSTEERYKRRNEFKSWGPLQAGGAVIADVNETFKTHYTREDAFDRRKAVEIFRLYTARYSKKNDNPERMARRWNGGPYGYGKEDTLEYWEEVKKLFDAMLVSSEGVVP